MPEQKETMETLKKLVRGLTPETKRNLLNATHGKHISARCNAVRHYLKAHGLDTQAGMLKYVKAREKNGCRGCGRR